MKFIRRALKHLPDEPDGALGTARDILDRALHLVWNAEAPEGKVPAAWIDDWKFAGLTREVEIYTKDPKLPEARGRQCGLLRLATGRQFINPVTKKVSKIDARPAGAHEPRR